MNTELKELRQLATDLGSLERELSARKKIRGIDFYIPNRIQYNAHQSDARVIAIVKGNRLGGTTFGALEVAFHITKQYPDWFSKKRRFTGPIKVRISTDKYSKFDSVIEPKLRQFIPREFITGYRRSPQGYLMKMIFKDGSVARFLTGEQDQMAWEGEDIDLYWGDEPVKRPNYVATQRGLIDRSGYTILTFTPLIESWMKEEIVDKADGKEIAVFYGSTRDNMFDIQGNPILHEEDIARFERTLTDDEKQTRIHGKFFHLRGMVYKEFSDAHQISDFKYEVNSPVICVLDPHDRQPHWLIWAMIDRVGDIYVMHESVFHGTTKQLAAHTIATEKYFKWSMVKRLIDPNFGRKPLLTHGRSVIDELAMFGAVFTEAHDSKETGRLKVKSYLHYDMTKPIDLNNRPKLYFVRERCPRTIRSMQNLQYDEWKGVDRDPKEDIKQKDTHGAHTVRYLCMENPTFYAPAPYEPVVTGAYY